MRTLIFGAGPIGQWLALRLRLSGNDVTLLARGATFDRLERDGVQIVDGLTGERFGAWVRLIDRLDPSDPYDLVVVAMQKAARLAACPILAANPNLGSILFLGNDVAGFDRYFEHLSREQVLLGFPLVGGGWDDGDLVIMDREKRDGPRGELCLGELDGTVRPRTRQVERLIETADIKVHLERDIDGWLKYHFAFMAPTVGVIFMKDGDLKAVADDERALHLYCEACREAGKVLREMGYHRRQPTIFNLFYWLPKRLEPAVFAKLFASRSAEVRLGLHARTVGPELLEMVAEFDCLKRRAGMDTPTLDALLAHVPRPDSDSYRAAS